MEYHQLCIFSTISNIHPTFKSYKTLLDLPLKMVLFASSLHLHSVKYHSSHHSVQNPWTRVWDIWSSFSHTIPQHHPPANSIILPSNQINHVLPPPTTATQDKISIFPLYKCNAHPNHLVFTFAPLTISSPHSHRGRICVHALCSPIDCSPPGSSIHGVLQNTGVGCHALLQGTFPTQGPNPCLLHLLHWQMGSLPLEPPGQNLCEYSQFMIIFCSKFSNSFYLLQNKIYSLHEIY